MDASMIFGGGLTNTVDVGGRAFYRSAAAEAIAAFSNTAGRLYSWACYNDGAAAGYIQFYDAAADPLGGDPPTVVLAESAAHSIVQFSVPLYGANGLRVALSSTRDTYTALATGHFWGWT